MNTTITAIDDLVRHGSLAITASVALDHVILKLEKSGYCEKDIVREITSICIRRPAYWRAFCLEHGHLIVRRVGDGIDVARHRQGFGPLKQRLFGVVIDILPATLDLESLCLVGNNHPIWVARSSEYA